MYGPYGDVIKEIDWSVGRIREALERHGILDDTMFIFTSDNGPWLSYGDHAGTTGGLREGKGTTFEGGVRGLRGRPLSAPGPRRDDLSPPGDDDRPPADDRGAHRWRAAGAGDRRAIDPASSRTTPTPRIRTRRCSSGTGTTSSRRCGWVVGSSTSRTSTDRSRADRGQQRAADEVRPCSDRARALRPEADPGEMKDVSALHPEVVAAMIVLADRARSELGDTLTETTGTKVRAAEGRGHRRLEVRTGARPVGWVGCGGSNPVRGRRG